MRVCPPMLLGRLPFTSAYLGSIALTLYAALVLHSYILVLLFSALQAAAVGWYLLSYIPGGAPILRSLTQFIGDPWYLGLWTEPCWIQGPLHAATYAVQTK